ncbi:3-hydroxyacyl-CoA dehydrogenase family protein [uncultured Desulfosarcina sp.]|uniref:3-hydroxyacyl-CoA dehydrogenase family protein n=1 Tax=uncultured Desulfosarcina sp. TaxID=218289 RepID=UPI0029C6BFC1|nr:3-hydroxyacyl-CoA dehydrogenase family protein [uncultured Desulfosarcina sp.]
MSLPDIQEVCVVGAGNMGHQIGLCCALAGYTVKCTDVDRQTLSQAEKFADSYLEGRVSKGKMDANTAKSARDRISFTPEIEIAASSADIVIEAIIENLALKKQLFAALDKICPEHCILATNSSYIVSSKIAPATGRPDKVCNLHFFNPALVMRLVEVVQGPHTSEETVERVFAFAGKLNKTPIILKKEIYGFVVNRILTAILNEALYLHDIGVADCHDIDTAVVNALGHPMGPFKLLDLVGVDLQYHVCMERYKDTGDKLDMPSPLLVEKFVKKEWGRKSGVGFYRYDE